jgi:phosphate-selective porin OprO and OprP
MTFMERSAYFNNAQIQVGTPKPISNYVFNGGNIQAKYTLTGENRAYEKKTGTLNRYYFGDRGPYENAFLVRDADGNLCSGRGAWEIACRYSYLNLNAGSGAAFVNGGIMNGLSLGLNWYLNTNLTVMNEWSYNSRYDLPGNGTNPGSKTIEGSVAGYGTRVQLSF